MPALSVSKLSLYLTYMLLLPSPALHPSPVSILNESTKQEDIDKWDSLGHLNLILAIEAKLGVKFSSDEIVNIKSIKDVIEKLQ